MLPSWCRSLCWNNRGSEHLGEQLHVQEWWWFLAVYRVWIQFKEDFSCSESCGGKTYQLFWILVSTMSQTMSHKKCFDDPQIQISQARITQAPTVPRPGPQNPAADVKKARRCVAMSLVWVHNQSEAGHGQSHWEPSCREQWRRLPLLPQSLPHSSCNADACPQTAPSSTNVI